MRKRVLLVIFLPPPGEPDEPLTEEDTVRSWRVLQASRLGFEWCDAVEIADSRGDMHKLADMIEKGCSATLAKEILL